MLTSPSCNERTSDTVSTQSRIIGKAQYNYGATIFFSCPDTDSIIVSEDPILFQLEAGVQELCLELDESDQVLGPRKWRKFS